MLTIQSAIRSLVEIEHILVEKGYTQVDTDLNLHWSAYTPTRVKIDYKCGSSYESETFESPEETDAAISEVIEKARNWAVNLKTPEQRARELFIRDFGRTLDRAREIGLEVDFLNPLEETMKRLSENILEAPF